MDEYSIEDVVKEINVVKLKLVENARLQLVAVEHSDLMNRVLHRATLVDLKKRAVLLHEYEHALAELLNSSRSA